MWLIISFFFNFGQIGLRLNLPMLVLLPMQQINIPGRIVQQTELSVTAPVIADEDIAHNCIQPCPDVGPRQIFIAVIAPRTLFPDKGLSLIPESFVSVTA